MKAIVTVAGKDKPGIIAAVSTFLAKHNVNIEDISQTVMQGYFSMIMTTDLLACDIALKDLSTEASAMGEEIGMSVRLQHEGIFNAMHKI